MRQPLNTCCLCCNLETGAYVLSGFGLFGCLVTICLASLILEKVILVPIPDTSLTIRIVGAVISIALYIMLIVGTKKRNPCLLLPFLILNFIGLCVHVVVFFLLIINSHKLPPETKASIFIGYTIALPIAFYVWMCMLSLYAKMRNDNTSGKVYDQYAMKI